MIVRDRLVAFLDPEENEEYVSSIRQLVLSCPVIVIDNVLDYMVREVEEKASEASFSCPRVVSPFQTCMLEGRVLDLHFGALIVRHRPASIDVKSVIFRDHLYEAARTCQDDWWVEQELLLVEHIEAGVVMPVMVSTYAVRPSGEEDEDWERKIYAPRDWCVDGQSEAKENLLTAYRMTALPISLSLSMMNCKNVGLEQIRPSAKSIKASRRRGRVPRMAYHVLKIDPMRALIRRESGHAGRVPIDLALHICRGHFKDYSAGSGLFGRTKGLFWWDQHARGKAERGVVVSDYDVSPSGESK
jgi:hypothetical protein